jgi:adenosine kinase
MKRLLVTGSLAYDRIMNFPRFFKDHFIPDKLHNINVSFTVDAPKREFGGTGGNIAYNLALLEEKPTILSTAGNDFDAYATWLLQNGIGTEGIEISKDVATASAYIITDQGDNQITAYSGGPDEAPYTKNVAREEALAIVAPTGITKMRSFPKLFKELGIPYYFDPSQRIPMLSPEDLTSIIGDSDAVFVNDYELALIKNKTGWSETDIKEKTKTLVVTLGKEGSRILTKDGEEHVRAVPVENAVDPTGAGDAYRAGFMKGAMRGLPAPACAKLGSVIAAYAVEHHGTQTYRFTLAEVCARYKDAYGEECGIVST